MIQFDPMIDNDHDPTELNNNNNNNNKKRKAKQKQNCKRKNCQVMIEKTNDIFFLSNDAIGWNGGVAKLKLGLSSQGANHTQKGTGTHLYAIIIIAVKKKEL